MTRMQRVLLAILLLSGRGAEAGDTSSYQAGMVVGGAGVALMVGGPAMIALAKDESDEIIALGLGMTAVGLVMAPAGSLVAGHAVRRLGHRVRVWPGTVGAVMGGVAIFGLGLAVTSGNAFAALGLLLWSTPFAVADLALTLVQLGLDADGRNKLPKLTLAPAPIRGGGAVVAVARW